MPISGVGTFHSTSGTGITTKSVTTVNAGDLIVFYTLIAGVALTATALSGGTADAGGWTKRVEFACSNGDTIGMWTARVGTPGTADVTVTWSGSPAGAFIGFGDKQWTAGLGAGTVWALDGTATGQNNASATTCAYPTKVPGGSGRLYAGYGVGHSVALVAGSTSGYTYHVDAISNCFAWNPNVAASTTPTTGTTAPQASSAIGMLLTATGSGPVPFLSQYNSFH